MRSFVAAALAIVGTPVLYVYSNYDEADNLSLSASSLRRKLRRRHPKFINPSFTDPNTVMVKQDIEASFHGQNAPDESTILNELEDINIWGTPAKLTSFGYKWRDNKCSNAGESENSSIHPKPKKKRAALCLYGGISPYTKSFAKSTTGTPDISDLSNVDWVAALYDRNLLPADDDFELDLFIHSWSETYFCTIARGFDGTRFTVRSIIAEPNDRHMDELFPLVQRALRRRESFVHFRQLSIHVLFNQQGTCSSSGIF